MKLVVNKTFSLYGKVAPPSSKSQSIRALLLASLAQGTSVLSNILNSDDTRDALNVCKNLGAKIYRCDDKITIEGVGAGLNIKTNKINSGNSGITTHFVLPILGLRQNVTQHVILDCAKQMRSRPIQPLVEALQNLGLKIQYLENVNTLPVKISGKLSGGKTYVSGITSQYLSALLFALPCAEDDSEIIVENLQERPYVDMTLQLLRQQNIQYQHSHKNNVDTYKIRGGQHYKRFNKVISNDFSSASYLIAASVLIPGEVILYGLDMSDMQGDKQLISILQMMGADITINSDYLCIRGGKKLSGIKIDMLDIPDLLPTLAVIATQASGMTQLYKAAHARIKETDRIHSMAIGLQKLGAKIEEHTDSLTIYTSKLIGCNVDGFGDHRTVMALALAGLVAEGTTIIDDAESINKTFPTFITVMQSIAANIKANNAIIN